MKLTKSLIRSLFPRLLFLSFFLLMPGCDSNDREGEIVTHYVSCQKMNFGEWASTDRSSLDRFNIVRNTRYQVSFSSERVVSEFRNLTNLLPPLLKLAELTNCKVYDRKNWTCDSHYGGLVIVKNGNRFSCSPDGDCSIGVDLITRARILVFGVDEVERRCQESSVEFEVSQTYFKIKSPVGSK